MKIRAVVDPRGLGALVTNLSTIASGEVARAANRELAGIYQGYVDRQFAQGRSPYGDKWPAPQDGGRPGWRSGHMGRTAKVRAAGNRITLSTGADYAKWFVRKRGDIFPNAADGLPPKWKEAADRVHRRAVAKKLRAR